jgi:ABC-type transporter Mla subunit MlaD
MYFHTLNKFESVFSTLVCLNTVKSLALWLQSYRKDPPNENYYRTIYFTDTAQLLVKEVQIIFTIFA